MRARRRHPQAGLHRRRPRHPLLREAPRRVPVLGLDLGLALALAVPGVVKGSGEWRDGS